MSVSKEQVNCCADKPATYRCEMLVKSKLVYGNDNDRSLTDDDIETKKIVQSMISHYSTSSRYYGGFATVRWIACKKCIVHEDLHRFTEVAEGWKENTPNSFEDNIAYEKIKL